MRLNCLLLKPSLRADTRGQAIFELDSNSPRLAPKFCLRQLLSRFGHSVCNVCRASLSLACKLTSLSPVVKKTFTESFCFPPAPLSKEGKDRRGRSLDDCLRNRGMTVNNKCRNRGGL